MPDGVEIVVLADRAQVGAYRAPAAQASAIVVVRRPRWADSMLPLFTSVWSALGLVIVAWIASRSSWHVALGALLLVMFLSLYVSIATLVDSIEIVITPRCVERRQRPLPLGMVKTWGRGPGDEIAIVRSVPGWRRPATSGGAPLNIILARGPRRMLLFEALRSAADAAAICDVLNSALGRVPFSPSATSRT